MNNNYILIGMPGCGKTTVGKMVAKKTNMKFVDIDEQIEKKYGDITKIFDSRGEAWFRKKESEELALACEGKNRIISTGGGIVEVSFNKTIMKTATVIFIDRKPSKIRKSLDDSKRPLMKNKPEALDILYERRYEKYIDFADRIIKNNENAEQCVKMIVDIVKKTII